MAMALDPETVLTQRKALAAMLREAGVGAQSDRFASLARPSVVLESGGRAGLSKLGGKPDLPPDLDWPVRDPIPWRETHKFLTQDERDMLARRAPLSFIAQVDLGHIARHVAPLPGLPDEGLLYFFYDLLHEGWGFDPADREGFRILWANSGKAASERQPPEPVRAFPSVSLGASYKLDPVDTETRVFEKIDTTDPVAGDVYLEWLGENRDDLHKLGGWPDVIQGEMESECALVTHGHDVAADTAVTRSILAEETDWRLLLQIGSDESANMMWGDAGNLYVWIRERDLKSRRFESCWTILQCY